MPTLKVELPTRLHNAAKKLAKERNIDLEDIVRLYLRAAVSVAKIKTVFELTDEMPFGKYAGEKIEILIRAEPRYIIWLLRNVANFQLGPNALKLLEKING